jgi:plastocyanin
MTRLAHTRTVALIALTGAVVLGATACGSKSGGGSSTSTTNTPAAGSSSQAMGTPINVSLKDYSITVASSGSLAPGVYTFHVTNKGPSSHNLTVNGPGVSNMGTPTFSPGGSEDLTVTLKNGTYQLYCSVPGHRQLGLNTTLTVGTGGGSSGGGTSGGGSSGGNSGGSSSSGGGWA